MSFYIVSDKSRKSCHQTSSSPSACSGSVPASGPSPLPEPQAVSTKMMDPHTNKKDVKDISFDILNIMGLHHRPHPNLIDPRSPGSAFLWEVYNSISVGETDGVDLRNWAKPEVDVEEEDDEWSGPGRNLTWSQFNINKEEIEAITKADSIVSFNNRGHRYSSSLLKWHEEEKQFWFDVSEITESDSIVLGAELRLWKRTLTKKKSSHRHKSRPADHDNDNDENGSLDSDYNGQVLRVAVKHG